MNGRYRSSFRQIPMTKNQTAWAEQAAEALANFNPLRGSSAVVDAGDRYDADVATWMRFVRARLCGELPAIPSALGGFDEAPFEDELELAQNREFDPPAFDDDRYQMRIDGAGDSG